MPDAIDDRLLADARRDEPAPPSFDDALATATAQGGPSRGRWLAVAATAVIVCGAAVTLAVTRSAPDTTPAAGPSAPLSSAEADGRVDRAVTSAQISLADDPSLLTLVLGPDTCTTALQAQAVETVSTVTVHASGVPSPRSSCAGVSPGPSGTGGYTLTFETVRVRLTAPLGDRPVIDGVSGRTIDVRDDSDTPQLRAVPAGYRPGVVRTPVFAGSNDSNTLGLDYGRQDRQGNTLMTHTGGREGIRPTAPVAGQVDGVPARVFDARFNDDPQHLDGTVARCVTWTPVGKQDRMICGTASAFDTAALLTLAEHYR